MFATFEVRPKNNFVIVVLGVTVLLEYFSVRVWPNPAG